MILENGASRTERSPQAFMPTMMHHMRHCPCNSLALEKQCVRTVRLLEVDRVSFRHRPPAEVSSQTDSHTNLITKK